MRLLDGNLALLERIAARVRPPERSALAGRRAPGEDPGRLRLSFSLKLEALVAAGPRARSGETVVATLPVALRLGAAALLINCSQPKAKDDPSPAARATRATQVRGSRN